MKKSQNFEGGGGKSQPANHDSDFAEHHFEFRGSAGEYFKIWIANIALTIVTLGIFSAWAKVRKKRYFYGNTYLEGENFQYNANPLTVLFSRVIIFGAIIGGTIWAGLDVLKNTQYLLFAAFLLPFVITRGHVFNARYSSHRNVPFNFITKDAYTGFFTAYAPFILISIAGWILSAPYMETEELERGEFLVSIGQIVLSLAVVLPWSARVSHRTKGANYCWGGIRADFEPLSESSYIKSSLLPLYYVFLSLSLIVAFLGGGNVMDEELNLLVGDPMDQITLLALVFWSLVVLMACFFAAATLFPLYWQGLVLPGGGQVRCDFKTWDFAINITLVNLIVTILSFGLLHPWAQVRKVRFLAKNMVLLLPAGTMEDIQAKAKGKSLFGEQGDEAGGSDIDVGLI